MWICPNHHKADEERRLCKMCTIREGGRKKAFRGAVPSLHPLANLKFLTSKPLSQCQPMKSAKDDLKQWLRRSVEGKLHTVVRRNVRWLSATDSALQHISDSFVSRLCSTLRTSQSGLALSAIGEQARLSISSLSFSLISDSCSTMVLLRRSRPRFSVPDLLLFRRAISPHGPLCGPCCGLGKGAKP